MAAESGPRVISFPLVRLDGEWTEVVSRLERECMPHPWSEQAIHDELTRRDSFSFGLLHDGQLCAYLLGFVVADELHILNLGVVPERRRQGLGYFLVESVCAKAAGGGATHGYLEVRDSNVAARKLYQKIGFQKAGVRRAYYQDTGEDALEMSLDLADFHPEDPDE